MEKKKAEEIMTVNTETEKKKEEQEEKEEEQDEKEEKTQKWKEWGVRAKSKEINGRRIGRRNRNKTEKWEKQNLIVVLFIFNRESVL